MKFEYKLLGSKKTITTEEELNELGSDGWRVIHVSAFKGVQTMILEREIQPVAKVAKPAKKEKKNES